MSARKVYGPGDIVGQSPGLTLVRITGTSRKGIVWLMRCNSCGKEINRAAAAVGRCRSCGCHRAARAAMLARHAVDIHHGRRTCDTSDIDDRPVYDFDQLID